jgi:hypothetical protein
MGWYTNPDVRSIGEMKDQLDKGWADGAKTLKSALVGNVYYAAVSRPDGSVFASIVLIDPKDEFACKPMTEHGGAYKYGCPKGIIDLLSPTDNHLAWLWRQFCLRRFPSKIDYPPYRGRGQPEWTIPETESWAEEQTAKLKASAVVINNGDYVAFKDGAFVPVPLKNGWDTSRCAHFKVVDKKLNLLFPMTREGAFITSTPRTVRKWKKMVAKSSSDMRDVFDALPLSVLGKLPPRGTK